MTQIYFRFSSNQNILVAFFGLFMEKPKMSTIYSNYEAVALSGTMGLGELGNGVTANTIHRVYCVAAGTISITPFKGAAFTFTATAHEFVDVVVRAVTVSSGTFIGFKAKFTPNGFQSYQGQSGF